MSNINTINGTSSANTLNGTTGDDIIYGFAGNDKLNGNLGNDTLDGGAGRDNFIFNTTLGTNNIDQIINFNTADDTIRLENAIFTKLSKTGTLSSSFFRANGGGIAQDSNDYILYDTSNGKLYYDADGNGAQLALQFAQIDLATMTGILTRSDFVVI
jgi:serralysin